VPDAWHAPWDDPLAAALHAPGASHQGYRRAGRDKGSLMTRVEREAWLSPPGSAADLTHGYPQGITPGWIRELQARPPAGFLDTPPGEYADVICGWFARWSGCGNITLVPSATMAFAIAVRAALTPGDEAVVLDRSYDSWPRLLAAAGVRVRYARRGSRGLPDATLIARACTRRTRVVVLVSPDNPLGTVCPPAALDGIAQLCAERGLTLIADHCLAPVNPLGRQIPLVPAMAGEDLSWIALADTSKILGLNGSKTGALMYPPAWREQVEAAASAWFFQHSQYDLAVIASVMEDTRPWLHELSSHAGAAYAYLVAEVRAPLTVAPLGAGPFALIDAARLGMDGEQYARLLSDRYSVLTVPVSWFPVGKEGPDTRIRLSLSRPGTVIERAAAALNASAAKRA